MAEQDPVIWRSFPGLNEAYLQDLYDRYEDAPEAVDPSIRQLFDQYGAPPEEIAPEGPSANGKVGMTTAEFAATTAGAVRLANAIRTYGHKAANLDPLGSPPPGDAALLPETHGIREEDLERLPPLIVRGPCNKGSANARQAIDCLRRIYQGSVGYEFQHVSDAEERFWLREAIESCRYAAPNDPIDDLKLLQQLTEVGALERFLHVAFPGQTRFSLEGLGMMVPVLDEIVASAAEGGTRCAFLGMAHRGRLNVLAHILGKPYEQLIAEFLGHYGHVNHPTSISSNDGWLGDVKYHLGARRAVRADHAIEMSVTMVPNPSHLEWVNPVVEGMVRASDEGRGERGPARQDEILSMAILIHGDASFPGQGVVAETLNLSRLPGFRTGGTIHIIANNQLGFTTGPDAGRSTLYASDLAKGFEIPIFHVNADDPEACIAVARLAHAYRQKFLKDVLIDLIGYRRWGHNEGDEPTFTQPRLYEKIRKHPTVRDIWVNKLVARGRITKEEADAQLKDAINRLHSIRKELQEKLPKGEAEASTSGLEAGGAAGGLGHAGIGETVETAVPLVTLAEINESLYTYPKGFKVHPKLAKTFEERRLALKDVGEAGKTAKIDWAHGEALAFGSILADRTPIRLSGQDSGRGTFSHRHAVLRDYENGREFIPLQSISQARASFEVWDSPLSEQATLGFEFGYSVQAPEALVLWEAQYGDFVNVPQVIIDQFIVSARSKWGQLPTLVMLLPHGYEGQGPEHSSARLERFLQMVAEDNIRIANCTTAAQYFHILRRQAKTLTTDPRPLVLMTPKSLLRNPVAASSIEQFTQGRFHPVLPDETTIKNPEAVRRLVFCSGKVYYDMLSAREESDQPVVALTRIEELYPFPAEQVEEEINRYPRLEEVAWVQEEPRNMGAWTYVAPRLRDILGRRLPLRYIGRTRRSSPSEGSHGWHVREQTLLVQAAVRCAGATIEESLNREVEHAG